MIRAAARGGVGVAVVPFCNIEATGGTIILIVPAMSCAGRLVSADLVRISLIVYRGCGWGGGMCGDWRGFLGRVLVTSGRHCDREMEVCHHLLDMFLGLLELVGKLMVGTVKVCHHLSLVVRGSAVAGVIGG